MSASKNLKPDAFWSARLKVRRARQHIDDLAARLAELTSDLSKYPIAIHADGSGRVGLALPMPTRKRELESVSLIVGDVVHNLRSALDHVVWAIFAAAGESPERCYFPFDVSLQSFVGQKNFTEITGTQ